MLNAINEDRENMVNFIWMDGELVENEDAKVHIMTSSLHYGLTIFEGIRAYSSGNNIYIFRLNNHVNRLFKGARMYSMNVPFTENEICEASIETVKANDLHTNCYIRPFIYLGFHPSLGISRIHEAPVRIGIIAHEHKSALFTGEYMKGLRAIFSSWRRPSPDSLPQEAKCSANYAIGALAQSEATKLGVRYAFLLDQRGFVSSGTGQSVGFVKGEEVILPSLSSSTLPGITRDSILCLNKYLSYPVCERDVTRGEVYGMDEVFVCGTGSEIRPVVEVDGIPIGDGPGRITLDIASKYYKLVTGNIEEFMKWMTPIY